MLGGFVFGKSSKHKSENFKAVARKMGAAILFLSSIVPIFSLIPFCLFGAPGWFVSSSYLRNSLSSFVIILGERIGINFVEGRL
jgi:hypothetical protein